LALKFSGGEGRKRASGRLSAPITASDITPFIEAEYAESNVVEQPFDSLNIANTFRRAAIGVETPIYRTPNRRFGLGLSFEIKESATTLSGIPLPPVGFDEDTINVSIARFTQEFTDQRTDQIVALRSSFAIGLPILGASAGRDGDGPDATFVTWLGQAQYVRRLSEQWRLVAKAQAQFASGPLFATEQLAIGGVDTVRG
jgi:hemolysin activation/secretion protein